MNVDLMNALGRFDDLRKAWLAEGTNHLNDRVDLKAGAAVVLLFCSRELSTLIDELSQLSSDV